MTVSLPSLLFRVRSSVAEIKVDMMDDLTMYRELIKANDYVTRIQKSGLTDSDLETPIVCLAAYYSHVTYTLLNARKLGTIDETVIVRQNELKKIARAMLLTITDQLLDKDLAIDESKYSSLGGFAYGMTKGAMHDTSVYTDYYF